MAPGAARPRRARSRRARSRESSRGRRCCACCRRGNAGGRPRLSPPWGPRPAAAQVGPPPRPAAEAALAPGRAGIAAVSPRGAAGAGSGRAGAAAPLPPPVSVLEARVGRVGGIHPDCVLHPALLKPFTAARWRPRRGGSALLRAVRGQEERVPKSSFSFSTRVPPARCEVPRHGGARQPHEHDEAQHQNPDPVGPEPGPDAGL